VLILVSSEAELQLANGVKIASALFTKPYVQLLHVLQREGEVSAEEIIKTSKKNSIQSTNANS